MFSFSFMLSGDFEANPYFKPKIFPKFLNIKQYFSI